MDMRFLETFYWVGTLKNFEDAAARMSIAQASASARVQRLEADLKVTLLDRAQKRVALTAAGTRLLAEAPALLKSWKHIAARLGSAESQTPKLRIGVIESVLHSFLVPWLEGFRAEQVGLELELTVLLRS